MLYYCLVDKCTMHLTDVFHWKVIKYQVPSCSSLLSGSSCRAPRMPQHQLRFLPILWCCLTLCLDFTGSASLPLCYFLLFYLIRLLVLQAISVASFIYVYLDKNFLVICFYIQSTIFCSLSYLKFLFITIYMQFSARIYFL